MSKQYNKIQKRGRRKRYLHRLKVRIKSAKGKSGD